VRTSFGRVTRCGRPHQVPMDLDSPHQGIRLVLPRHRPGTEHRADRDRGRRRVTLQEAIPPVPGHQATAPTARHRGPARTGRAQRGRRAWRDRESIPTVGSRQLCAHLALFLLVASASTKPTPSRGFAARPARSRASRRPVGRQGADRWTGRPRPSRGPRCPGLDPPSPALDRQTASAGLAGWPWASAGSPTASPAIRPRPTDSLATTN
jgi:hypothetical protein